MKEIGGYLEMELNRGNHYYNDNVVMINCARNCLAYLIEAKEIRKLFMPCFLCGDVKKLCNKYAIDIEYYRINEDFTPNIGLPVPKDAFVYIINYYGQLSEHAICEYRDKYENIIVDNVQTFFTAPINGVDTIYSCRKFFGVSDGAYLFTDVQLSRALEIDISFERMIHVLGRYELNASTFFERAVENNNVFENEEIKSMSLLTQNLLSGIDYGFAMNKRKENFEYVHSKLRDINGLKPVMDNGPFAYPLLVKNGQKLRRQLIENKVYVPMLWADALGDCAPCSIERMYIEDIIPLPCDQRYNLDDMKKVADMCMDALTT